VSPIATRHRPRWCDLAVGPARGGAPL